jgi:formylglycine-generating enzyme required for sulfatase activity
MDGFMWITLSTTNCTVNLLAISLFLQLVHIAAGSFVMGGGDELDERPRHIVRLSAFSIDVDEVTRADYDKCVRAGACQPRQGARSDDSGSRIAVTGVSWFDASAYCKFVGERLPSEAEWERAARGSDGKIYPWGNDVDCTKGNFGNFEGEGRCPRNPGKPVAVGSYGGAIHDLAGNVWEWVADWYDARYYARAPTRDPHGPRQGQRRVARGGACCSMFGLPRASKRLAFPPAYRDDDLGFRCAKSD